MFTLQLQLLLDYINVHASLDDLDLIKDTAEQSRLKKLQNIESTLMEYYAAIIREHIVVSEYAPKYCRTTRCGYDYRRSRLEYLFDYNGSRYEIIPTESKQFFEIQKIGWIQNCWTRIKYDGSHSNKCYQFGHEDCNTFQDITNDPVGMNQILHLVNVVWPLMFAKYEELKK